MNADTTFHIGSKQEIEEQSSNISVLPTDEYIVKLAHVRLEKKPTFLNGGWNGPEDQIYSCIFSVHSVKSGDPLVDVNGNNVEPLTSYIYRDINPYSVGFQQDNVTPSILRGFLCYVQGKDVNGGISAPDFHVINTKTKEVELDEEVRSKCLAAVQEGSNIPGYTLIPAIEHFQGAYVGASVAVTDKGKNKISGFKKKPQSFTEPTAEVEKAAEERFNQFLEKVQNKRNGGDTQSSSIDVNMANEEVSIDDVAI